jgi:hypothetical protein
MTTINELELQIQALQEQLEKKKKEDQSLTPTQRLAKELHDVLCLFNHTDGCSWEYEKDWNDWAHAQWLGHAQKLQKACEEENIEVSSLLRIIPLLNRMY